MKQKAAVFIVAAAFVLMSSGFNIYPAEDVTDLQYEDIVLRDSFRFDMWDGGINIREAFKIAASHDLPLERSGRISVYKRFNPGIYKFINTSDGFYYNTKILGKSSQVSLFFTPRSRLLYNVTVRFHGPGVNNRKFKDEILAILDGKYGARSSYTEKASRYTRKWNMYEKYTVRMVSQLGDVKIVYSDISLSDKNVLEK